MSLFQSEENQEKNQEKNQNVTITTTTTTTTTKKQGEPSLAIREYVRSSKNLQQLILAFF